MLKTVTGVYENGQFELAESPQITGRARVIVTFLDEAVMGLPSESSAKGAADQSRERRFHWQEARALLTLPDESVSEGLRELRQSKEGVS